MKRQDILTYMLFVFLGVAIGMVIAIVISTHQPTKYKAAKLCNDGWSVQEEDGKIYETYIPENDTCNK